MSKKESSLRTVREQNQLQNSAGRGHWVKSAVVQQGGLDWTRHHVAPKILQLRTLKTVSFSVTSVFIIDYHQHPHCLLPAVASCQNIKVSFSSNYSPSFLISSNCFLHLLFVVLLSPPEISLISSEWGIFIIVIISSSSSAVIVAITVVVFTSLPPAETRSSNSKFITVATPLYV